MLGIQSSEIETILSSHGVRPTANRIMVASAIAAADHPLSQMDIEDLLQTVDRSTVSRSVALFQEAGLLHSVDDGSGIMKYELCRADHDEADDDTHVHFHCRKCGKTRCFHDVPIPQVPLPEGFEAERSNFVVTGICPGCSRSR